MVVLDLVRLVNLGPALAKELVLFYAKPYGGSRIGKSVRLYS